MKLHMPRFEQSRVLVVGDLMLDRYWHGNTTRVSPEAPVPVVDVKQIEDRPGGAGNVALNIALTTRSWLVSGLHVGACCVGGWGMFFAFFVLVSCCCRVSPAVPNVGQHVLQVQVRVWAGLEGRRWSRPGHQPDVTQR